MLAAWQPSKPDRGMTALIEGMFAFAWFGWGQADVTANALRILLAIGGVAGLLVAVGGGIQALRSPAGTSALHDRRALRVYGFVVGLEFVIAGVGAGALGALGYADFIPAWVAAVVGVHFFPLARLLHDRSLPLLGTLMLVVAAAALGAGMFTDVAPSTVAGIGAGTLLLEFGARALALRESLAMPAAPAPNALHEAGHRAARRA